MTSASAEPGGWTARRWLLIIGLVLLAQLGAIVWLARQKPAAEAPITVSPSLILPAKSSQAWPLLSDPALFVLANRRGFSGEAWMKVPAPQFSLPEWQEDSRPLPLPAERLGGAVKEFIRTNPAPELELAVRPEPALPAALPEEGPLTNQSYLTLEGEIANRPLRAPLKLHAWPATDRAGILSSSVVQVGVDRNGSIFSAVLDASGKSGSKEADSNALSLAQSARFQPLRTVASGQAAGGPAGLQWGRMVFHWETLAAPATNAPVLTR